MPTSAPGNRDQGGPGANAGHCTAAARVVAPPSGASPGGRACGREGPQTKARGFTLIELLIVVAIVALASTLATLALRDPDASALEREADRLSALLEAARAESRASGLTARWVPAADAAAVEAGAPHFRFVGLPAALNLPQHWLTPQVRAEVIGARSLLLGPEPLIGAQRVSLRLGDQRLTLATEGLGPFEVQHAQTSGATPADREARASGRP